MGFLQKLFGSHSDHELKRIYPIVDKIEREGEKIKDLETEALRADEFNLPRSGSFNSSFLIPHS